MQIKLQYIHLVSHILPFDEPFSCCSSVVADDTGFEELKVEDKNAYAEEVDENTEFLRKSDPHISLSARELATGDFGANPKNVVLLPDAVLEKKLIQ
mmetsp:Transcript_12856/g.19330  ORF Transcript_12856/g.19330 Transcript_12856/m.19330 type:complete len:97 (+) Transcript_12856:1030-1320(+)